MGTFQPLAQRASELLADRPSLEVFAWPDQVPALAHRGRAPPSAQRGADWTVSITRIPAALAPWIAASSPCQL